jgi:UDP-2-acetamido-3-amino-2,3-dideoxy-glucuronate N-acetyltransferase
LDYSSLVFEDQINVLTGYIAGVSRDPVNVDNRINYLDVGAGAVVTKHVPAFALMVGNPARQMGWMSEFGHRLEFDAAGIAHCPEGNDTYRLVNNLVEKIEK